MKILTVSFLLFAFFSAFASDASRKIASLFRGSMQNANYTLVIKNGRTPSVSR